MPTVNPPTEADHLQVQLNPAYEAQIAQILAASERIGEEAERISHAQAGFGLVNVFLILGNMAELLEGHIEVYSKPVQGSRFDAVLPLAFTKIA